MQNLIALLVAAIAVLPTSTSLQRSDPLLVRKVLDGDTIEIAAVGRVRLLGLAAPFGQAAHDRLESLVLRRWVRLEYDTAASSTGSRHLAYVIGGDGVFVNAALVRDGLARVSARPALSRFGELKRAERDAQALHLGMWAKGATGGRSGSRDESRRSTFLQ
jgi:endonuclease YncB( thermonuclease family)